MRIGFCLPKYTLRGADTVLWAFAYFSNGRSLPHESHIFVYDDDPATYEPDIHEPENREAAALLFAEFRDTQHLHECTKDTLESALLAHEMHVAYMYLAGFENERASIPTNLPVITHCIFNGMVSLGTVHTVISNSVPHLPPPLSKTRVLPNVLVVANHSADLRERLKIPPDAVVFGRYGGRHTFSIEWVKETVCEYAAAFPAPHVYFIFMNTQPFSDPKTHPNIIYLQGAPDLYLKRAFINTCDAMLHARADGETFGCAIGEFAISLKPIITSPCLHRAFGYPADGHLDILAKHALVYTSPQGLTFWLNAFRERTIKINMENNPYFEYIPDKVMPMFQSLLEEAVGSTGSTGSAGCASSTISAGFTGSAV
jgi:hypothetical protein